MRVPPALLRQTWLVLLALAPAVASAQRADSARHDSLARAAARNGTLPLVPTRPLKFTTDEGTWMSLDVSPDGRTIVFDILGDLYTLPIDGGKATRITSGQAFDAQPRFSPDGKRIVFVSDRDGSDNIWIADADGRNPRQLTKGDRRSFISPTWTPDGQYVVATAGGGVGETQGLKIYHVNGGSGAALGTTDLGNATGIAFLPGGRWAYVARRGSGASGTQLALIDISTGKWYQRTSGAGGGFRPAVSPDGKWLVFGSRLGGATTGLVLRELSTGDDRTLVPEVQHDELEARGARDALPSSAFTPDSRALIASYGGKIWRVAIPSGTATQIPFTADIDQMIGSFVHFEYPHEDTSFVIRQLRAPRLSPDGRRVAFTALERLYVMDLADRVPHRVTPFEDVVEHSPVWSPDGRTLAFLTWTEQGGHVYRIATDAIPTQTTGAPNAPAQTNPQKVSTEPAFYDKLNYTPDGRRLLVARGQVRRRNANVSLSANADAVMELVWLPATGGAATTIAPLPSSRGGDYGWPHMLPSDSTRIYIYDVTDGLVSMRWDGTDRRSHLKFRDASGPVQYFLDNDILLSPNGRRALIVSNNQIHIAEVPPGAAATTPINLESPAASPIPVRRITRYSGIFPWWSADGRTVSYSLARSLFLYDVDKNDAAERDALIAAAARDSSAAPAGRRIGARVEPQRIDVSIRVPKDRPEGTVVLRGARIITAKGAEVIPNGDVVVKNNRIVAVGAKGSVAIPSGAKTIDVAGKTIIPGWVDIHAHMLFGSGVHRQQVWEYLANLAYGVTTAHDPSANATDFLSYYDLAETGQLLAPRLVGTGPAIYQLDNPKNLDEARDLVRRHSEFYHTNTIKQYMIGDRKQRQWITMAAAEQGMTSTCEGGQDFKMNLTLAMDGYSGLEHTLTTYPMYKDVITLMATSQMTYTPTFIVSYGGPSSENYFYEHTDARADKKLARFTPANEIDKRTLRRTIWAHETEWLFPKQAAAAGKILDAGGRLGLGAHGQIQGLGVHWELWSYGLGGLKPQDIIRIGTILSAEAIGMGKDIGSLEAGKLADLQVLDANPLENIRNTTKIRYVMKNGRLYEAETLKEIWPRTRELERQYWQPVSIP